MQRLRSAEKRGSAIVPHAQALERVNRGATRVRYTTDSARNPWGHAPNRTERPGTNLAYGACALQSASTSRTVAVKK